MTKPTYEQVYDLLKKHYKHDRFEGRNGKEWGEDYSHRIAKYDYDLLLRTGFFFIPRHSSVTGKSLKINQSLEIQS